MSKRIVVAGGCFDIIHAGHIKFLKEAKKNGGELIILLESDENIKKLKGVGRPFHNLSERKAVLMGIKYVDKIITLPKKVSHKTYDNQIKKIKPDYIVTTDDDPIINKKFIQARSVGAKLKIVKKYKSHSTTKITKLFGF